MQIDHAQEKCHRQGCRCSVPNGEAYCSEHCRKAGEAASTTLKAQDTCACGHGECAAGNEPAGTPS